MAMNTAFRYPPYIAPTPRAKPRTPEAPAAPIATTTADNQATRDSNALRASVLDAALQLGLGTNSTVANWIFNNPLEEEDENPRSPLTPGLTNNDTAGSDESYHYPSTPPAAPLAPHKVGHTLDNGFITIPKEGTRYTDDARGKDIAGGVPVSNAVAFPENLPQGPQPVPSLKGKLRKKRGDGYESDGGYLSEGAPKSKKKEKDEMKRKKSKKQLPDDTAHGYDTDFAADKKGSKSKSKGTKKGTSDAGYETDGYTSSTSKKKGRFFGLRSKQSKQEPPPQELPLQKLPSLVATEPIVLPIASKFATSAPPPSTSSTGNAPPNNTSPVVPRLANSASTPSLKPPTSPPSSFAVSSPSAILNSLATAPNLSPSSRWSNTPSEVPTEVPPLPNQLKSRESLASLDSSESHAASSAGSHVMSRVRRVSSSIGHGSSSVGHGSSSTGHGSPGNYDNGGASHSSQARTPSRPGTADSHSSRPTSPSSTRPYPAISFPLTHKPSLNHKTSFTGRYPTPGNSSPTVSSEAFGNVPSAENTQTVLYHPGIPPSNNSSPMTPSYPPSAMSNTSNRIPSRAPSPSSRLAIPTQVHHAPASPGGIPSSHSPAAAPSAPRPRPKNPPTEGFGPRSDSVSPLPSPALGQPMIPATSAIPRGRNLQVVTTANGLAPPPPIGGTSRAPSPMVVPSEDFVVPSPSRPPSQQIPLPSPNVLAYYDIPPPSPPPSGPLPSVPPGSFPRNRPERERTLSNGSSNNGHGVSSPLSGRISRQTSSSRLAGVASEQSSHTQVSPVAQRGKESPFPAKPTGAIHASNSSNGHSIDHGKPAPVRSGLEATIRVPRYRELYALALPEDAAYQKRRQAFERMGGDEVERFEAELNKGRNSSHSQDDDEIDEAEIQDVLARFKESTLSRDLDHTVPQALGRSQSIKALQRQPSDDLDHRRLDSVEVAGLPEISDEDDDEPISAPTRRPSKARKPTPIDSDSDSDDSDTGGRWTESLYSRASFLDPEKSEEARERFIRRVEEMYNESGRERDAVPPVPKLPTAYAAEPSNNIAKDRSWLRF